MISYTPSLETRGQPQRVKRLRDLENGAIRFNSMSSTRGDSWGSAAITTKAYPTYDTQALQTSHRALTQRLCDFLQLTDEVRVWHHYPQIFKT